MTGLNGLSISSSKVPDGSYYYFSRLTNEQKNIYKTILTGIRTFATEIRIPIRPINEISMIFDGVLLDNPMIFYVLSFRQTNDLFKEKCFIRPDYKFTRHITKEYANTIRNHMRVFDSVKEKSEFDKEIYVHDYCLSNFTYDYTFSDYSYSVLGVVLNKTAVCEGIAKFVKLAFDYLGIKSLVVSGKAKNPAAESSIEGHAWNIVRINERTHHLDVTFDMTLKNNSNRYDYFNLTEEDIKKDHIIIGEVPVCTNVGYDYFSINSLAVRNFTELENYIKKALKDGKKNIIFKMVGMPFTENAVAEIMKIAQRQYGKTCWGSGVMEASYNASQMVFEIIFRRED